MWLHNQRNWMEQGTIHGRQGAGTSEGSFAAEAGSITRLSALLPLFKIGLWILKTKQKTKQNN